MQVWGQSEINKENKKETEGPYLGSLFSTPTFPITLGHLFNYEQVVIWRSAKLLAH